MVTYKGVNIFCPKTENQVVEKQNQINEFLFATTRWRHCQNTSVAVKRWGDGESVRPGSREKDSEGFRSQLHTTSIMAMRSNRRLSGSKGVLTEEGVPSTHPHLVSLLSLMWIIYISARHQVHDGNEKPRTCSLGLVGLELGSATTSCVALSNASRFSEPWFPLL